MIDPDKAAQMQRMMGQDEYSVGALARMTETELRGLMEEILVLLPKDELASLNLEEELVSQYRKTKDLMDEVLADMDTPANQKAQVCNAVVSTLGQLVKLQEDLRKEQTLKVMEACLVEAIKTLPEQVKNEFFSEYERMATKAGLM
jgi:hypothetical protein